MCDNHLVYVTDLNDPVSRLSHWLSIDYGMASLLTSRAGQVSWLGTAHQSIPKSQYHYLSDQSFYTLPQCIILP